MLMNGLTASPAPNGNTPPPSTTAAGGDAASASPFAALLGEAATPLAAEAGGGTNAGADEVAIDSGEESAEPTLAGVMALLNLLPAAAPEATPSVDGDKTLQVDADRTRGSARWNALQFPALAAAERAAGQAQDKAQGLPFQLVAANDPALPAIDRAAEAARVHAQGLPLKALVETPMPEAEHPPGLLSPAASAIALAKAGRATDASPAPAPILPVLAAAVAQDGTTSAEAMLAHADARAPADAVDVGFEKLLQATHPLDHAEPQLNLDATRHDSPRARLELALPPGAGQRLGQAFSDGMSAHIGWMAEQKIGRAEIRLHPADLGSVDVQLKVDGNQVRAEFQAANADVRHAIEQSLPRLRDLFSAHGLNLAHADVGQQSSAQQGRQEQGQPGWAGEGGESADTAKSLHGTSRPATRPRLDDGHLSEYA